MSKQLSSHHFLTVDRFYGIAEMAIKNKLRVFSSLLQSIELGVTEIMCHPGYVDAELKAVDNYL